VLTASPVLATAQPNVEPAAAIADGPAKAWLLADLDTGAVLASKDPHGSYAPASTIKVLLAMVVLDHLSPDNFARANQSHTQVECLCVGLVPGQPYTGWESVTTPHDLAMIFRAALTYPLIAHVLRQPSARFPGKTLAAQNELLSRYPGDLGGKTGYTNLARKTYVGAAQRGTRRLVVVQMYGSGDLYGQATALLDWGFSQP
jgi:D-alanyl-D-alanine carboxypeptidase (penicillin-binding protein 5/6)